MICVLSRNKKCVLVYNKDRDVITAREPINYIKSAIIELGYSCRSIPFDEQFMLNIIREDPHIVFNYYTATGRSQMVVPSILENMKVRYTGSDSLTQALAIDKEYTNIILKFYGIPVPQFHTAKKSDTFVCPPDFPLMVKPALGGSSEGISYSAIVCNRGEIDKTLEELFSKGYNKLLVSSFIKGKELTVGVMGSSFPQILGILETRIRPDEILTEEVKEELDAYDERVVTYSGSHYEHIKDVALKSYKAINCKGYARIDIRLGEDEIPYVIDINALPGLHPRYSYLSRMAEDAGLGYKGLIREIIEAVEIASP